MQKLNFSPPRRLQPTMHLISTYQWDFPQWSDQRQRLPLRIRHRAAKVGGETAADWPQEQSRLPEGVPRCRKAWGGARCLGLRPRRRTSRHMGCPLPAVKETDLLGVPRVGEPPCLRVRLRGFVDGGPYLCQAGCIAYGDGSTRR